MPAHASARNEASCMSSGITLCSGNSAATKLWEDARESMEVTNTPFA
jgi:hypothetical protein